MSFMQKVAKHAEPAANELSDRMEEGADKFSKNAGPAAKELSEKAVKAAHHVKEHAGPKAHQVRFVCMYHMAAAPQGHHGQQQHLY